MNFSDAVKSGFVKCFDFSGRATRPEYWYFTLFYALCSLVGDVIVAVNGRMPASALRTALQASLLIFLLLPMVPHLAVATRRLHDTNHSGWWVGAFFVVALAAQILPDNSSNSLALAGIKIFVSVAALAIGAILLVWLISRGTTDGPNRFGPPRATAPIPE